MPTEVRTGTAVSNVSFGGTSASRSQNFNSAGLAVQGDSNYYTFSAQGAGTNTLTFRFRFSDTTLTIPTTATIDGILFRLVKKRGNTGTGSITESTIQLFNGTTNIGNNKAVGTAYPTTDTLSTYGGATDLWGATLTPTILNDPNFRISYGGTMTVTAGTVGLDFDLAELTVYYTDSAPAVQTLRSVGGGVAYTGGGGFIF